MGADGSVVQQERIYQNQLRTKRIPGVSETYLSLDDGRLNNFSLQFDNIYDFGYSAVWGVSFTAGQLPEKRVGHATAYDRINQKMYIGFGLSTDKKLLDDVWEMDMNKKRWNRINIQSSISPRAGARMVFAKNKLWVFGGFANKKYYNDFFTIDVNSGYVEYIQATGTPPSGCSGFTMNFVNDKVVIYGGYGRQQLKQCKIYNTNSRTWSSIETKEARFSHSSCLIGSKIYIYGGSSDNGMVCIDMDKETVKSIRTFGQAPPIDSSRGSFVQISNKLIAYIDGSCSNFMFIRVYDIDRCRWTILPIFPDGDSTFTSECQLNEDGYYMLPAISDVSCVFNEKQREVNILLGKPFRTEPMCCNIFVGQATAAMNLQADMCSMIKC